jgi:hypothetical protein
MNRWLFLPESAVGDLELLSSLDDARIAALIEAFDSDDRQDKYELALQLGQILDVTDQTAAEFLTFWEYVQREQRTSRKSADEVIREIIAFLTSRPDSKSTALARTIASKSDLLLRVFGDFPRRDLARRIQRFETGPLPHVHSVESVCDIRPVFERGSEHVSRLIPLITMRIGYHDACDEHRELILQLTEEGLRVFEEDLARIRRRLEVVRASIANFSASEAINGQS